jgi:hypothetical protein
MSILSDLNPMSLISNAAQAVCHEVLPQKLQFVGDIVGLGLDFESGNWMKGIEDLQKLLKDLPQTLATLDNTLGSHKGPMPPWSQHSWEAPPPPPYASLSNSGSAVVRGAPPRATDGAPATSVVPSGPSQSTSATSGNSQSQSASADASSTPATGGDAFFRQSDADLMNKVVNGQIPDSITKDPAKMQQLQARMNQISLMNQLISQMMAAIHDMQKQVAQNIRA